MHHTLLCLATSPPLSLTHSCFPPDAAQKIGLVCSRRMITCPPNFCLYTTKKSSVLASTPKTRRLSSPICLWRPQVFRFFIFTKTLLGETLGMGFLFAFSVKETRRRFRHHSQRSIAFHYKLTCLSMSSLSLSFSFSFSFFSETSLPTTVSMQVRDISP